MERVVDTPLEEVDADEGDEHLDPERPRRRGVPIHVVHQPPMGESLIERGEDPSAGDAEHDHAQEVTVEREVE